MTRSGASERTVKKEIDAPQVKQSSAPKKFQTAVLRRSSVFLKTILYNPVHSAVWTGRELHATGLRDRDRAYPYRDPDPVYLNVLDRRSLPRSRWLCLGCRSFRRVQCRVSEVRSHSSWCR